MFTFKKIERLCSKTAIEVLFKKGKSKTQFPIKVIYLPSEFESPFPVRAMFVVPKKKHKRANKRNILKRRMREVYRLHKQKLYTALKDQKVDLMFIMLSNEEHDFKEIEKSMSSLLDSLVKVDFEALKPSI